jgi:hypothetical protein
VHFVQHRNAHSHLHFGSDSPGSTQLPYTRPSLKCQPDVASGFRHSNRTFSAPVESNPSSRYFCGLRPEYCIFMTVL